MSTSRIIESWLVLGPIYNEAHQSASHSPDDCHPTAADIIMDIENNTLNPKKITGSSEKAQKHGTKISYGTDGIFNNRTYMWRSLSFSGIDWDKVSDVEDNIHKKLGTGQIFSDPQNPQSFAEKHHALAFFLIYIKCPNSRTTTFFVKSDDSIRVWLNGSEIESLRFAGDRDITDATKEASADITLQEGTNILLAAVAETHMEWGFVARITNADDLVFSTEPFECSCSGQFLDGCHLDLPPGDVIEEIEFERFFQINLTFQNLNQPELPNILYQAGEIHAANEIPAPEPPNSWDIGPYKLAFYMPFTQQWKLDGYARGRLVNSFSLGPGEEQTLDVFTWDRMRSSFESSTSFESEQSTENSGSRRDTLDVSREMTRQIGLELTSGGKVGFQVGVVNVDLKGDMSARTGINESERSTRNAIVEATTKATNRVRTSRILKVTESRESGREERVTRKLRNPNTCHTLTIAFFEVLAKYRVTTFVRTPEIRLVVLIPSPQINKIMFNRETIRIHETALRLALLDRELEAGFAAARLLAARDRACSILCRGCTCDDIPSSAELPEWIQVKNTAKDVANAVKTLLSRQILFPFSIAIAEAKLQDGISDIKRHLFKKSCEAHAPRLLTDVDGLGISGQEVSESQAQALARVIAALPVGALALLGFDPAVSDSVYGATVMFIRQVLVPLNPLTPIPFPAPDPVTEGIAWGAAVVRAIVVKKNTDNFTVYDDAGLLGSLSAFIAAYDAWVKAQQAAQQANEKRAELARIAKEERELRILESFGLKETAEAEERLQALLDHLQEDKNIAHYRFAIWNERKNAVNDAVMALALAGFVDPTPVGIVDDQLAVPVRIPKRGSQYNDQFANFFDESLSDLLKETMSDERRHILPTPALYSESIVGECSGCETYVENMRSLDLRQRTALAMQAEQEAERYTARLKATPPVLDHPNPSVEAVRVRLETVTEKTE